MTGGWLGALYLSISRTDPVTDPVIGMTPALEAESAGGMTKVPKAW